MSTSEAKSADGRRHVACRGTQKRPRWRPLLASHTTSPPPIVVGCRVPAMADTTPTAPARSSSCRKAASSSRRVTCEPMKPAAPVTSTVSSVAGAKARFLQSLQRDRACRGRRMQVACATPLRCTNYRRPGPMASKKADAGKFPTRPGAPLNILVWNKNFIKRAVGTLREFCSADNGFLLQDRHRRREPDPRGNPGRWVARGRPARITMTSGS